MTSQSFDDAAAQYDATRGFPPGIAEQVAEAAADLLGHRRRVLEVGIGTGRIGLPLLARGLHVTGLDLSRKMMNRLLANVPAGTTPPTLVQGDAEAAPFADGAFEAVVSVHVFHLLGRWRAALDETRRLLAPGGAFLSGYEWRGEAGSPGVRLMAQWRAIVQARGLPAGTPGTHDFSDIMAALVASGAEVEERSVGQWEVVRTPARQIETIEHRTWSNTWQVPPDFFPACLAELRAWAEREFGDLNRPYTVPHRFIWQRFVWPERRPAAI